MCTFTMPFFLMDPYPGGIYLADPEPKPVWWIRIRMELDILPGSGSGIIVPDFDPATNEEQINKTVIAL